MKKLFFVSLLLTLNSSFGADILNKSIRVGKAAEPNPFSVCVANQAVDQLLSTTINYKRLLHSMADLRQQPAMKAQIAFLADTIGDSKRSIFKVELTSLDRNLGWQLVRDSSGELAPYSTYISSKGMLLRGNDSIVDVVDLSLCSEE